LKRLATRRGRTEEEKVEHHFPAGGCLARNHLDVRGVGGGGGGKTRFSGKNFLTSFNKKGPNKKKRSKPKPK